MLRPSQIHLHPHKPAIYVDYVVNPNDGGVSQKTRRRLIPVRGLRRSKNETHNAAALAERLLLRHTDLLAHVGRERLRVVVQHVISIITHEIAVDLESSNGILDEGGEREKENKASENCATSDLNHTVVNEAENPFVIDGNVDLNKLGDEELHQVKQELDKEFNKIRIKPDDPNFVYDRRVEFSKEQNKEDNDWDMDNDESEVGYIPSQPQPASKMNWLSHLNGTGTTPVSCKDDARPLLSVTVISPVPTVPEESFTIANRSPQSSLQAANHSDLPIPRKPVQLEGMAPSPVASSPAASVISELSCEDIPPHVPSPAASPAASPTRGDLTSPAADPVAESPSLLPPSSVMPSLALGTSAARQAGTVGMALLPADPIPEDAYEDDFSDFGAGETASHVSSKPSSSNHLRSSTHQSETDIEVGATDSEHESDADETEEKASHGNGPHAKSDKPMSVAGLPPLNQVSLVSPVASSVPPLQQAGPLKSMHESSDIEEDIDEEIEAFEDDCEGPDN